MKLGIMQPYFFPYIGYWQLINSVDKFVIYEDVNYIKGGWINRNRILMNNQVKYFSLRIKNASSNMKINEIYVLDDVIYNNKMLKTIEFNYKKAPNFSKCYSLIEDILEKKESNLATFLEYSIKKICEYLLISTEILISSEINKNDELKGQKKVIEICKLLNASDYINMVGGYELYSFDVFKENNIKLMFLKSGNIEYKQFTSQFSSNLSIIDIMMFNSIDAIKELLNSYELI